MKLKLSEYKGIHILTVTGPVVERDFSVLKAGMTKLFQTGKNRMILELVSASELDDSYIRELGKMNLLAREMAGEVVVVAPEPQLRQKIENFGLPNAVTCKEDKAAAYEIFVAKAASSAAPTIATPKAMEALNEEIKKLRELLKSKEGGEAQNLKSENAQLKSEKAKLEDQLLQMVIQRRLPADEGSFREKVRMLEEECDRLLAKVASLESQPGKSG